MRKLLICCAACLMALCAWAQTPVADAVRFEQGGITDWYMLSTTPKVTMGTSITIAGKSYDLTQGEVKTAFGTAPADEWETIREDMTVGEYGTVCLPRTVTETKGATFYEVVEFMSNVKMNEVTTLQAGKGYVCQATESTIQVKYTGAPVAEPIKVQRGLQGTFVAIQDGAKGTAGNILEGNYIVYNNQFRLCAGTCSLAPYHAYLLNARFAAEGIGDFFTMNLSDEPITGLGQWNKDNGARTMKVIKNGILYILRDNKVYNAQGMKL